MISFLEKKEKEKILLENLVDATYTIIIIVVIKIEFINNNII
jgi:hypothetical protein